MPSGVARGWRRQMRRIATLACGLACLHSRLPRSRDQHSRSPLARSRRRRPPTSSRVRRSCQRCPTGTVPVAVSDSRSRGSRSRGRVRDSHERRSPHSPAPNPQTEGASVLATNAEDTPRGPSTRHDISVLRDERQRPLRQRTAVTLGFRFLSEEYPGVRGSRPYNDGFIAELDHLDAGVDCQRGLTIDRAGKLRLRREDAVISINTSGATSMSAPRRPARLTAAPPPLSAAQV